MPEVRRDGHGEGVLAVYGSSFLHKPHELKEGLRRCQLVLLVLWRTERVTKRMALPTATVDSSSTSHQSFRSLEPAKTTEFLPRLQVFEHGVFLDISQGARFRFEASPSGFVLE